MCWTAQHDLLLLRETILINPFQSRKGSPERGQHWKAIADNLNSIPDPKFSVDQRSVRDHLALLEKKFKKKMTDQIKKGTGSSPEPSESDIAMEQIIEMQEASQLAYENESESKKEQLESERLKAEDIRKKAMEKLGDTKKRKGNDTGESKPTKKSRRTGSDAIEYLKSKSESDMLVRTEELEIKKQQQQIERERNNLLAAQQAEMQLFQQRMEQQQQWQQQQLCQQNQMLLALLEKLVNK